MTCDSQISQVFPGSVFLLRSSSLPARGKDVLSAFFFLSSFVQDALTSNSPYVRRTNHF